MTTSKLWTLIAIFLVAIIVVGGIVVWSRCSQGEPLEISEPPAQSSQGRVYIGGAVINPGFYPFKAGDSIEALVHAAGGTVAGADLARIEVHIPRLWEEQEPQKININRAEAWLLEALPGIGEVRAQAIVDYRQKNGPFNNINALIDVKDIGANTYETIKHLITVAD